MSLQCKSIIFNRLWRVGCRLVVLGRRIHFGRPKTQLANFVNFVDFSLARFVYIRASAHSLIRKIRLNINFQCLKIITHSLLFSSIISPFGTIGICLNAWKSVVALCKTIATTAFCRTVNWEGKSFIGKAILNEYCKVAIEANFRLYPIRYNMG